MFDCVWNISFLKLLLIKGNEREGVLFVVSFLSESTHTQHHFHFLIHSPSSSSLLPTLGPPWYLIIWGYSRYPMCISPLKTKSESYSEEVRHHSWVPSPCPSVWMPYVVFSSTCRTLFIFQYWSLTTLTPTKCSDHSVDVTLLVTILGTCQ